jgi:DNA-binding NarL/FixJ family response regulator
MKSIKILLVDDSAVMREALRLLLERMAHVTVVGECTAGNQVLDRLKQTEIDLVFMDVMMKKVGGYEAARIIKQYNKHIKVIFFSFLDLNAIGQRANECGADGFVSKVGVTKEMIINELEKITGFKVE